MKTNEDKQLLLKDLCARLPYGVKILNSISDVQVLTAVNYQNQTVQATGFYPFDQHEYRIEYIKPYLRSIDSMTDEEFESLNKASDYSLEKTIAHTTGEILIGSKEIFWDDGTGYEYMSLFDISNCIDWLNKNHFDYRGLIKKGLAVKVTEDNNPYKE